MRLPEGSRFESMTDNDFRVPRGPDATPAESDRLDSWKEIAGFLRRDVRTVQRWEKQAGLPVHRHAESRLRTAYAYRSELEAWWRRQAGGPDVRSEGVPSGSEAARSDPSAAAPGRVRAVAGVVGGLAALILVSGLTWLAWHRPARSYPAPRPVVSTVELDGALTPLAHVLGEMMERRLSGASSVTVLPPAERVRRLRLMRLGGDAPLTVSQGRELLLRGGEAGLVLAARLHRVGERYVAGLEVVEPVDASVVWSDQAYASRPVDLLPQVDRLLGRAIDAVPERTASLPRTADEPLPPVTTASLDALRLYAHAVDAARRGQWAASELLTRRAIALDERFASAYAALAWAVCNQARPVADCLEPAARALELADGVSDRESYFNAGTYYLLAGDTGRAVAAFEALVRIHPTDARALDQLIDAYARAGRVREAAEHMARRAAAAPDDFYANVRAAQAMRIGVGDAARAWPFLARSRALAGRDEPRDRPSWRAWLTLLPAFEHWMSGDVQGSLQAIDHAAAGLDRRIGPDRDAFATAIGFAYLALGRVADARRTFGAAGAPARQIGLATLALAVGDRTSARNWLQRARDARSTVPALFAAAGLTADAEDGLDRYFAPEDGSGVAALARGLVAIDRGRIAEGIAALGTSIELLRDAAGPEYFLAVEALADAWRRRGEPERAAVLLADAARARERTYGQRWSAAFWIRINGELIALSRERGREDEARRREDALAHVLAVADRPHPDPSLVGVLARATR
jgi:tetratricopeptide (TPR) repeat protein